MPKFTNTHVHVFNAECAPQNFLRIIPVGLVRSMPGVIKWLIERRRTRQAIRLLDRWLKKSRRRGTLHKYVSFLKIGTRRSQKDVFEIAFNVAKRYDSDARVVGLTMDMDHMDNQGNLPDKPFETQLAEVRALKSYYPRNFYPFLGVDPRARSGDSLVRWARNHFEQGVYDRSTGQVHPYFTGIKFYPALGFFPFDPRLEELFEYAQDNRIPIMSHCTRSGSFYVGNSIESLIPRQPPMIDASDDPGFAAVRANIYDRIGNYYKAGLVKNHRKGANDLSCDLFCHPENYVPVLMKFPRLKVCLAHMGGSDEIKWIGEPPTENWQIADGINWSEMLPKLMDKYPNFYTDISYTLADLGEDPIKTYLLNLLQGFSAGPDEVIRPLNKQVLFGTDFYMTEQETTEEKLFQNAIDHVPQPYFDQITRENPLRYLFH